MKQSSGTTIELKGAIVEAARTKAVTPDEVKDHIDRMGSTPFVFANLEVELDEGVGIGFSALHKIRAMAADQLEEAMLEPYHARLLKRVPARAMAPRVRKGSCKVAFGLPIQHARALLKRRRGLYLCAGGKLSSA